MWAWEVGAKRVLKYGQGTFCFTSSGIDGMVWSSWLATLPRRKLWKRP